MATPESTHNLDIFSVISNFLNSMWGWLLPVIGGIFHLGKVQQRITIMQDDVDKLKNLHSEVAQIRAGVDILLSDRHK